MGVASVFVLFFLFWNKRLKAEVALRKQIEEDLRDNEQRYKEAQRMGQVGNWEYELGTERFWGSEEAKQIYGFDPESKNFTTEEVESCIPERQRVHRALMDLIEKDIPYNLEFEIRPIAGPDKKIIKSIAEIMRDDSGTPIKVIGLIQDISERKQAEERIKSSLKEKEVLLSEVHHRVKNNMQVITSLLRLQSSKIKDKQYTDMFKNAEDRIRSMALIHEMLYQTKDFAKINFNDYAKRLANQLIRNYATAAGKIKLNINIEDIPIGLDKAIPCGLIINELISNSLKYAYPKGEEGEIRIVLRAVDSDEVDLIVSDDGTGISKEIDIGKTESLGLQLVHILAEDQLDGSLEVDREEGTAFKIRFKK